MKSCQLKEEESTHRKAIPGLLSKKKKKKKSTGDSCIRGLDRIGVSKRGKSSAAWPKHGGRYAVSKFERAISMKIAIKDRQRSKSAARFKGKKTVSKRRRANKAESLRLHSV